MPTVRISHTLSPAEVRARMAARVGDLAAMLPGGMGSITHAWESADRLAITVHAMGQVIESHATAEADALVITYTLPAGAMLMKPMVNGMIRAAGDKLLLDKA
jgi:hypothetical protein